LDTSGSVSVVEAMLVECSLRSHCSLRSPPWNLTIVVQPSRSYCAVLNDSGGSECENLVQWVTSHQGVEATQALLSSRVPCVRWS
jgi:hypothetical protein